VKTICGDIWMAYQRLQPRKKSEAGEKQAKYEKEERLHIASPGVHQDPRNVFKPF